MSFSAISLPDALLSGCGGCKAAFGGEMTAVATFGTCAAVPFIFIRVFTRPNPSRSRAFELFALSSEVSEGETGLISVFTLWGTLLLLRDLKFRAEKTVVSSLRRTSVSGDSWRSGGVHVRTMSRELERTGIMIFLSLAIASGILNALGAAPAPAFVVDPAMTIGETVLDNWSGGLLAGDEDVDGGISGGKALGAPRGD